MTSVVIIGGGVIGLSIAWLRRLPSAGAGRAGHRGGVRRAVNHVEVGQAGKRKFRLRQA